MVKKTYTLSKLPKQLNSYLLGFSLYEFEKMNYIKDMRDANLLFDKLHGNEIMDILEMENVFKKFNFYSYKINGEGIFCNDKDNLIKCRFCNNVEITHKQFGNHLEKCKFKKVVDLIKDVFKRITYENNNSITPSIELLDNYSNGRHYDTYKEILEFYSYYEQADDQQDRWNDLTDSWKRKINKLTKSLNKINHHKKYFEEEWKKLVEELQDVEKRAQPEEKKFENVE